MGYAASLALAPFSESLGGRRRQPVTYACAVVGQSLAIMFISEHWVGLAGPQAVWWVWGFERARFGGCGLEVQRLYKGVGSGVQECLGHDLVQASGDLRSVGVGLR